MVKAYFQPFRSDDVSPAIAGTGAQLHPDPAAQQEHTASQDSARQQFQQRRTQ
jgi:hypothetical protein